MQIVVLTLTLHTHTRQLKYSRTTCGGQECGWVEEKQESEEVVR